MGNRKFLKLFHILKKESVATEKKQSKLKQDSGENVQLK
jgi:hypothetical protein